MLKAVSKVAQQLDERDNVHSTIVTLLIQTYDTLTPTAAKELQPVIFKKLEYDIMRAFTKKFDRSTVKKEWEDNKSKKAIELNARL